jgi:hypothetical protein
LILKNPFFGVENGFSKNIFFNIQNMAANNGCIGVKADGVVCGKRCRNNNVRCATHLRVLEDNGPNALARKEMGYIHKKQVKDIESRYEELLENVVDVIQRHRMNQDMWHEVQQLRARQAHELTILTRQQEDEVRRTGVDPDAPARARAAERDRQRMQDWRERQAMLHDRFEEQDHQEAIILAQRLAANVANAAAQQARPVPRVGELGQFARDAQNVHTTVAVKQTKDMVARILKISVPNDFKWNARTCSKTPGEIITECGLSAKGAWQMVAKYCQDESVYDMGAGIYGKTLDGVWQYIVNSPDKRDLCRILRQEMEDNIGMCAQGNLTRLCNILAGYMEGIGVQESPSEILGRKLPKLMEIEDQTTRVNEAYKLLIETGIPEEQWLSWVEPLVDGSVRLKSNGAGQVIGLEVV